MSVDLVIDLANAEVAVSAMPVVELDISTEVPGISIGLPGPQGPPGAPSNTPGPPGATGPTGPAGLLGGQGATGPTGPAGALGPTGPVGGAGAAGGAGPTGPTGAAGSAGSAGAAGPTGPSAFQGVYDGATTYHQGDVVDDGGALYVDIHAGTVRGSQPSASPTLWAPMVGLVWRGAWSAGTSYLTHDVVGDAGSSYVATAASTGVDPTSTGSLADGGGITSATPADSTLQAGWWRLVPFTTGAGGVLGGVRLRIASGGIAAGAVAYLVDLGATSPGTLNGTWVLANALTSGSVPASAGDVSVTFAAPVTLTGGHRYAVAVKCGGFTDCAMAAVPVATDAMMAAGEASWVVAPASDSANFSSDATYCWALRLLVSAPNTSWSLLAAAGVTGPVGPTGPVGAAGIAGAAGPTGPTGPVSAVPGPTGPSGPVNGFSWQVANPAAMLVAPVLATSGPGGASPINAGSPTLVPYNDARVTHLGCTDSTVNQFSTNYIQNAVNASWTPTPWAIEFEHYGDDFAIRFRNAASGASVFWVWVDGKPATAAPQFSSAAAPGSLHYYRVTFAAVAQRRIRVYLYLADFGGIDLRPTQTLSTVPKATLPKVAFYGDSFVEGTGAATNVAGFADTLGRNLGAETFICGQGGTGWNANGGGGTKAAYTDSTRLARLYATSPDVVVVYGSTNDDSVVLTTEPATMLNAIRANLPAAKIVVVGPMPLSSSIPANRTTNAATIATATAAVGGTFVNPLVDEAGVAWVYGTGTSTAPTGNGNADLFTSGTVAGHPTQAGHDYMARRIGEKVAGVLALVGRILTLDPQPTTDIQIFNAGQGQTWTKPAGAKLVRVISIGCGGSGGSGRRGAAGTVRQGGGGGGGGGVTVRDLPASILGATEQVNVGTGVVGGASVTTDNTDGLAGTGAVVNTTFGPNQGGSYGTIAGRGGPGGGGGVGAPTATVLTKALTSNVASLTFASGPIFVVGQTVTITGVDATFNGTFVLTVASATSISYAKTAADVASIASPGQIASTNTGLAGTGGIGQFNASGGATAGPGGAAVNAGNGTGACGGAGSGGGVTTADAAQGGGNGGTVNQISSTISGGTGGVVGGAAPLSYGGGNAAAVAAAQSAWQWMVGAGGGAGSKTAAGQAGADGLAPGGPGGGGGGTLNGFATGVGGKGGDGLLVAITFF